MMQFDLNIYIKVVKISNKLVIFKLTLQNNTMIDILVFIFVGIVLGIITGLIPGLHPNLLATLLVGYIFAPPLQMSLLIISAGVTNSFLDFIPSIMLGAPEAATALSVLPGHEFLLQGRGYEAIKLTVIGGLAAVLILITLLPFSFYILPLIYTKIEKFIPFLLIAAIVFILIKDRKWVYSSICFILAGIFGLLVLRGDFLQMRFSIFPMLTGLFGLSTLIYSIKEKPKIPKQNKNIEILKKEEISRGGSLGSLSGYLVGILPGIGPALAAFLSQEILGGGSKREFMISIGGINTSNIIISILGLYLISKARSGVAIAVRELFNTILFSDVIVFIGVVIFSSSIAALLTLVLSKKIITFFQKINYLLLCSTILIFLMVMVLFISGIKGLFVALVGASIGLFTILSGARRSLLMGCLIIPVILFYFGL